MTDSVDAKLRAYFQRPGPGCAVPGTLAQLSESERAAVSSGLDIAFHKTDRHVTYRSISRFLRSLGYDISDQTLGRHRRGDCTCE